MNISKELLDKLEKKYEGYSERQILSLIAELTDFRTDKIINTVIEILQKNSAILNHVYSIRNEIDKSEKNKEVLDEIEELKNQNKKIIENLSNFLDMNNLDIS